MDLVDVQDYIFRFENVLPKPQCRQVIDMFEASDAVSVGRVIHSDVGHAVNQDKISHDLEIVPGGDSGGCYDFVHNAVAGALQLLIPKLPSLQVYPLQGSGYKIQKYPKGEGKFNWHFDALGPETQKRLLALILYLDDVEQGGETEFFYQGLKVQPKAGNAIMFPTAWTHMHCGHVPVSSDKYIVSSFFYFVI